MPARTALFCLALASSFCVAAQPPACLRLTHAIARGEALSRDALEAVACTDDPVRVLYDGEAHLVRAARDMAVGEVIAAVPPQRMAAAVRGQAVRIRHRIGAVSVTREGTALVDAAPGKAVIAITADGRLIRGLPLQEAP